MKKIIAGVLALSSTLALANTTVIHNVKGYTPTQQGNIAEFSTLVLKDRRVLARGDESLLTKYPDAQVIDGQAQTLLPGLIDAHGHVIGLGESLDRLDLRGTTSIEAVGEAIKAYAEKSDASWIIGRGWNQQDWPVQEFGSAADLDKFESERPVVLTRIDGHAIWVNSKAMELANISRDSVTPSGGEIIVDPQGNPSGVFIDKAEQLILQAVPAMDKAYRAQLLDKASDHLLSLGITSTHDAGIDYETYELYKERASEGALKVRLFAMLSATDARLAKMLSAGKIADANDMLSIRSVKLYADGALGSRGAALIDDYADRKGHRGLMLETQAQIERVLAQCFKAGFSVNTHAIGDRANREVLNAYENVFKQTGGMLLRNRIEHAQIVNPEDIPRFKALKIIPSMQPVHATSDMHMAEQRLSDQQLQGAYAWRTFLKQGSKVVAGSDFPVELANPFHGLFSAITRQDHAMKPEGGWRPEEKITREQALRAFTLDAAYSAHQEFKIGSLEQGKWADFILVDTDYFNAPVDDIWQTNVLQTWVAGERVYQRP